MSATTLPSSHGTATGQPQLLPAKSAQLQNNVQFGQYGNNVATHDRRAGIHAEIGWEVELAEGYHEIWAQYSGAETRPMTMKLDGRTVLEAALWDTTPGWHESDAAWYYQATVRASAGAHQLTLERANGIPHVIGLAVQPVLAPGSAPDADRRFGQGVFTPPLPFGSPRPGPIVLLLPWENATATNITVSDGSSSRPSRLIPAGPGEGSLRWTVNAEPGIYEVWARYQSPRSCPMRAKLGGEEFLKHAMWEPGLAWAEDELFWQYQAAVQVSPGSVLEITGEGAYPSIAAIGLVPIAIPSATPDADLRFANEQARHAASATRPLIDTEATDLIRASEPTMRDLLAQGVDPAEIGRLYADMAQAITDDLAAPLDRVGFSGPLNGQMLRIEIFRRLDEALRFDGYVETGAYMGTTTEMFANLGRPVFSCEIDRRFFLRAATRLAHQPRVTLRMMESRDFLREFFAQNGGGLKLPFFYLDAHWGAELPLPEEIDLITNNCERFVLFVDDFKHPDFQYGFDRYGNGPELSLEYCLPRIATRDKLVFMVPDLPPAFDTGRRRGTLIVAPRAVYETTLKNERLLRLAVPL